MRTLPNLILAAASLLAVAVAGAQEPPARQMLLSSLTHLRSGDVYAAAKAGASAARIAVGAPGINGLVTAVASGVSP